MSNQSHTIYAGSTIDLLARVRQHEEKLIQAMNPNWLDLTARLSDLSFLG